MLKQVLLEAVKAGGEELNRFFNKEFKITNKAGVNNPVTEADHASEAVIINIIKKNFPDHQVLAEETGAISHGRQRPVRPAVRLLRPGCHRRLRRDL